MRFYTNQHKFYCGIDLHTNKMYVCILNRDGDIVLHRNMRTRPEIFLQAIKPFREDLVVSAECMFTWYWLADLCEDENIPFVLGHALYMRAIHGGKSKNDKIDSLKIAALLRGGLIPQAYTYPRKMRATRDLMRRRNHFMRKRAELFAHIQKIPPASITIRIPWGASPDRITGRGRWSVLICPVCKRVSRPTLR